MASFLFFLLLSGETFCQAKNTIPSTSTIEDTNIKTPLLFFNYGTLLDSCVFLNHKGKPTSFTSQPYNPSNFTSLFYCIAVLFLLFGFFKSYFQRYFDILTRVFFNTTLKQNQLTDQLVSLKLPSLIFNCLFVIFSGFYIFILINFLENKKIELQQFKIQYLAFTIIAVAACYFVKYLTLQLVGWATNLKQELNAYIFIVFLLNKILGIFLLLILPLIIFGNNSISSFATLFSLTVVLLFFLLRYYRFFTQLKSKLKLGLLHLLLIVVCLEVLPLGIIFKLCLVILNTKA